jgi:hypothetical protein
MSSSDTQTSRDSILQTFFRVAKSMPAICSLMASWFCDHPRRLRNLRTCGPMMLRCLIAHALMDTSWSGADYSSGDLCRKERRL